MITGRLLSSRDSAFTIIEVMIASSILAIALTALAGSIFSLQNGREAIADNRKAVEIAQAIIERIQGETWDSIGKSPATWHRRAVPTAGLQYVDQIANRNTTVDFMHRPLTDEPAGYNLYEYVTFGQDDDRDGVYTPSGLNMEEFDRDAWNLPFVTGGQASAFNATDPASAAPSGGTLPTSLRDKYNTSARYNWLQFIGVLEKPSGLRNLQVFVEYYRQEAMSGITSDAAWEVARAAVNNQIEQSHIIMDLTELDDLDAESVVVRILVTWDRKNATSGSHEVIFARRQ